MANFATSHVLSCSLDRVYKAIPASSENARQRGQRSDGESREPCCPEPARNPSQRAASARGRCPCANSATQIRHTTRWQRAPRDCAGLAIVCRPVMAAANRNQTPVKVRPRKGWVGPPRAAAARDRSSSSADPPPKHPSEIPEAVSSLISRRVTF